MGEAYKISELSKLYDICSDTMRHYERQGLLNPIRGENGYRVYGIRDVCNLNVIRNLRNLDVPLETIKRYILNRTVASTVQLLEQESEIIEQRIEALRRQRQDVLRRAEKIRGHFARPTGGFELLELPPRPCYRLQEDAIVEKEIDFVLKKLEKKYENVVHLIGPHQIGAILDTDALRQGIYNHYSSVLIITDQAEGCEAMLPGGLYASTIYPGRYENFARVLPLLLRWIGEQGYEAAGAPLELYIIDEHETNHVEEYRTEVQIPVRFSTARP